MSIEKETEEKIFLAAQRVFQKKGFDGARMQEIADEAGINKSMLHYYYRSKEKLFRRVFQAGAANIFPSLIKILESEMPIRQKVEEIVDFYYSIFRTNPFLPAFVVHEMNRNPKQFREFIMSLNIRIPKKFSEQIKSEVEGGRMMPLKPHHFLMNVVSMCMMPMVARQMVQAIFRLDDEMYWEFLEERKEMISKIIFSGIKP
ncbi:MAG: TetR/AcrR family transcriptional regulator [Balneolaceae bacterium]|nr:MAG: TetR/AcrR family transcriptional regulator [Balneolaceae bacterium]